MIKEKRSDPAYASKSVGNGLRAFFSVKEHLWFGIIIIAAIFLRFYGLSDRGITLWDASYYANIAKTPIYVWNYVSQGQSVQDTGGLISYLDNNGCKFSAVRPGHTFFIFLSFLFLGIKEWAVLFPSALSGVLSVLMVYLIGARFFSKEAGLISASFIALSGFQVAFSRTGYPQTDSLLVLTLLIYFYFTYRQSRRKAFLYVSGFILGVIPFFHPSLSFLASPLVVDFVLDSIKKRDLRTRDICTLALVGISPLLLEEIVFGILNHLFPGKGAVSIISFFLMQKGSVSKGHNLVEGFAFFIDMIVKTDGFIWAILYLGGLLAAIFRLLRKRDPLIAILVAQVLIPVLFWALRYPTLKAINVCYPALSLILGYSMWRFMKRLRQNNIGFFVVFFSIILTANYDFLLKQVYLKINYKEAILETKRIVEEKGGSFTAKDQKNLSELLEFYMPLINTDVIGNEFRGEGKHSYRMIDYRQMKNYPEYVDGITRKGNISFRKKLFNELLPITHYHRLKKKGYEYIRQKSDKTWLYVTLHQVS